MTLLGPALLSRSERAPRRGGGASPAAPARGRPPHGCRAVRCFGAGTRWCWRRAGGKHPRAEHKAGTPRRTQQVGTDGTHVIASGLVRGAVAIRIRRGPWAVVAAGI